MRDPYEAYYRRSRRRHRTEVAVVVGGLFLALILVSAVVLFWHTEVDQQAVSVNKENIALNN
jgi:NADH:ubiquinone oxidoreductase subunit 6 (subunit J)